MKTFVSIIDCWPSLQAFADDLGVPYGTAQVMRHRNSIAAKHWENVVSGAKRRAIQGVTFELLARIKAAKTARPRETKRPTERAVARPERRVA